MKNVFIVIVETDIPGKEKFIEVAPSAHLANKMAIDYVSSLGREVV